VEVNLNWAGEMNFDATSQTGAKVRLETGVKYGGSGKNATPMETVLIALAGCAGMDAVLILQKMKVDLKRFDIKVDGRRREGEPAPFEEIKMTFVLSGENLTKEKADKAVDLSVNKYCSVGVMLRDTVKITYETRLE
jgi:putative redox protein